MRPNAPAPSYRKPIPLLAALVASGVDFEALTEPKEEVFGLKGRRLEVCTLLAGSAVILALAPGCVTTGAFKHGDSAQCQMNCAKTASKLPQKQQLAAMASCVRQQCVEPQGLSPAPGAPEVASGDRGEPAAAVTPRTIAPSVTISSADPAECTRTCGKKPGQTLAGMRVCVDQCLGRTPVVAMIPSPSAPPTSIPAKPAPAKPTPALAIAPQPATAESVPVIKPVPPPPPAPLPPPAPSRPAPTAAPTPALPPAATPKPAPVALLPLIPLIPRGPKAEAARPPSAIDAALAAIRPPAAEPPSPEPAPAAAPPPPKEDPKARARLVAMVGKMKTSGVDLADAIMVNDSPATIVVGGKTYPVEAAPHGITILLSRSSGSARFTHQVLVPHPPHVGLRTLRDLEAELQTENENADGILKMLSKLLEHTPARDTKTASALQQLAEVNPVLLQRIEPGKMKGDFNYQKAVEEEGMPTLKMYDAAFKADGLTIGDKPFSLTASVEEIDRALETVTPLSQSDAAGLGPRGAGEDDAAYARRMKQALEEVQMDFAKGMMGPRRATGLRQAHEHWGAYLPPLGYTLFPPIRLQGSGKHAMIYPNLDDLRAKAAVEGEDLETIDIHKLCQLLIAKELKRAKGGYREFLMKLQEAQATGVFVRKSDGKILVGLKVDTTDLEAGGDIELGRRGKVEVRIGIDGAADTVEEEPLMNLLYLYPGSWERWPEIGNVVAYLKHLKRDKRVNPFRDKLTVGAPQAGPRKVHIDFGASDEAGDPDASGD